MKEIFGIYNMRARISVATLLFAPIILQSYILIPELRNLSSTIIITLISYSLSGLIILYSRKTSGKILNKCFPFGLPAQQYLLLNDNHLNKHVKERYYNFFKKYLTDFTLSTNEEEMKKQADSAITWLISQTRDNSKFSLIAEENMNLGFAYNLLGIKKTGISLCLLMLIINSIITVANFRFDLNIDSISFIYCIISNILGLLMWIFFINKSIVVNCGKKYAYALLSACDSSELNKN